VPLNGGIASTLPYTIKLTLDNPIYTMTKVLFFLALLIASASAFVAPVQHAGTQKFT
jgi:hypothetical protein